ATCEARPPGCSPRKRFPSSRGSARAFPRPSPTWAELFTFLPFVRAVAAAVVGLTSSPGDLHFYVSALGFPEMSKGKGRREVPVQAAVWALLQGAGTVTSGEVAKAAGVTRQAAHYNLRRMSAQGLLSREGAGRGSRYRRVATFLGSWSLAGVDLQE